MVFSIILKYNIIVINFQFFVGKELTPIIESVAKVLRISASIGSEAGIMSIGTGGGVDKISMKVSYINRFEREPDIWLIAIYKSGVEYTLFFICSHILVGTYTSLTFKYKYSYYRGYEKI